MQVIVHGPRVGEELQALQKKAAAVHAQAVTEYIQKLSCPREQKLKLLREVEKSVQEQ